MVNALSPLILQSLKSANPNAPDGAIEVIRQVLTAELLPMFLGPDGIENDLINVYAKHFTPNDVKELLAFYASPVGQKAVAALPVLTQESAALGQRWWEANMARVGGVLQQRLRAEGFLK
jgi:hypothetical protein